MEDIKNYRKKPVVIQAIKWSGDNLDCIIKFCKGHSLDYDRVNGLFIYTLKGRMKAKVGDYIIRDVAGEFYPCKESIFHMTYEEVIT